MSKNKKRRPQAQKPKNVGNEAYMRGMQEIRFSNAAGTHRSAKDYRRKPKYFKGWE